MKLGQFELKIVSDGTIGLDGGAMFGVVPKVLWEQLIPADDKNRITLGLNSVYIKTPEKQILVETGVGSKEKSKFEKIYRVERDGGLMGCLEKIGVKPGDIDIVINTHLHFDHAGGNTVRNDDGTYSPAFSHARYYIQKGEWEEAVSAHERNQASYFEYNLRPVEEAGQLELIDGETEIVTGIETIITPGHTGDHQCVLIQSEGEKACFLGDLVPMTPHLKLPYIMSYDLYPVKTLEAKREIYRRAIDEHWLLLFVHDTFMVGAYLEGTPDAPELKPGIENPGEDIITPIPYEKYNPR